MTQAGEQKKIWVTTTGLPLTIELEWPFHRSTSGADFWVLHGEIRLENSDGLHAPVAVNLSATVKEVLASLEPKDAEAPVINAVESVPMAIPFLSVFAYAEPSQLFPLVANG